MTTLYLATLFCVLGVERYPCLAPIATLLCFTTLLVTATATMAGLLITVI
jgi:hypothetical protein